MLKYRELSDARKMGLYYKNYTNDIKTIYIVYIKLTETFKK